MISNNMNDQFQTMPNKRRRISLGSFQVPFSEEQDGLILPELRGFSESSEDEMRSSHHDSTDEAMGIPSEEELFPLYSLDSFHVEGSPCTNNNVLSMNAPCEQDDDETDTTITPPAVNQAAVFEVCNKYQAKERNSLIDTLGFAPTIGLGQMTLVSRLEWSLPLANITQILKRAPLLTSLNLFSIAFEGDKQEFEDFCFVFKNLSSLKELHIVDCCLVDQSIQIDPLLNSLAGIPCLETVEIYAMDLERETTMKLMSPESLGVLCRSPTITTLSLQDLDLCDDHVQEVAQALRCNDTLKSLTLWDCNVTDKGGRMLADMIKQNTCLEKADLSFNDLQDSAYNAIASALCSNETLLSLSLHGNNKSSLLCPSTKSPAGSGYEALLEVIRDHNHILKEMILEDIEDPRIMLYLTINRNRHLLQDEHVTQQQLVDCLADHNDEDGKNLSFVYHLLRTTPELCQLHP